MDPENIPQHPAPMSEITDFVSSLEPFAAEILLKCHLEFSETNVASCLLYRHPLHRQGNSFYALHLAEKILTEGYHPPKAPSGYVIALTYTERCIFRIPVNGKVTSCVFDAAWYDTQAMYLLGGASRCEALIHLNHIAHIRSRRKSILETEVKRPDTNEPNLGGPSCGEINPNISYVVKVLMIKNAECLSESEVVSLSNYFNLLDPNSRKNSFIEDIDVLTSVIRRVSARKHSLSNTNPETFLLPQEMPGMNLPEVSSDQIPPTAQTGPLIRSVLASDREVAAEIAFAPDLESLRLLYGFDSQTPAFKNLFSKEKYTPEEMQKQKMLIFGLSENCPYRLQDSASIRPLGDGKLKSMILLNRCLNPLVEKCFTQGFGGEEEISDDFGENLGSSLLVLRGFLHTSLFEQVRGMFKDIIHFDIGCNYDPNTIYSAIHLITSNTANVYSQAAQFQRKDGLKLQPDAPKPMYLEIIRSLTHDSATAKIFSFTGSLVAAYFMAAFVDQDLPALDSPDATLVIEKMKNNFPQNTPRLLAHLADFALRTRYHAKCTMMHALLPHKVRALVAVSMLLRIAVLSPQVKEQSAEFSTPFSCLTGKIRARFLPPYPSSVKLSSLSLWNLLELEKQILDPSVDLGAGSIAVITSWTDVIRYIYLHMFAGCLNPARSSPLLNLEPIASTLASLKERNTSDVSPITKMMFTREVDSIVAEVNSLAKSQESSFLNQHPHRFESARNSPEGVEDLQVSTSYHLEELHAETDDYLQADQITATLSLKSLSVLKTAYLDVLKRELREDTGKVCVISELPPKGDFRNYQGKRQVSETNPPKYEILDPTCIPYIDEIEIEFERTLARCCLQYVRNYNGPANITSTENDNQISVKLPAQVPLVVLLKTCITRISPLLESVLPQIVNWNVLRFRLGFLLWSKYRPTLERKLAHKYCQIFPEKRLKPSIVQVQYKIYLKQESSNEEIQKIPETLDLTPDRVYQILSYLIPVCVHAVNLIFVDISNDLESSNTERQSIVANIDHVFRDILAAPSIYSVLQVLQVIGRQEQTGEPPGPISLSLSDVTWDPSVSRQYLIVPPPPFNGVASHLNSVSHANETVPVQSEPTVANPSNTSQPQKQSDPSAFMNQELQSPSVSAAALLATAVLQSSDPNVIQQVDNRQLALMLRLYHSQRAQGDLPLGLGEFSSDPAALDGTDIARASFRELLNQAALRTKAVIPSVLQQPARSRRTRTRAVAADDILDYLDSLPLTEKNRLQEHNLPTLNLNFENSSDAPDTLRWKLPDVSRHFGVRCPQWSEENIGASSSQHSIDQSEWFLIKEVIKFLRSRGIDVLVSSQELKFFPIGPPPTVVENSELLTRDDELLLHRIARQRKKCCTISGEDSEVSSSAGDEEFTSIHPLPQQNSDSAETSNSDDGGRMPSSKNVAGKASRKAKKKVEQSKRETKVNSCRTWDLEELRHFLQGGCRRIQRKIDENCEKVREDLLLDLNVIKTQENVQGNNFVSEECRANPESLDEEMSESTE
eukprot:GHVP01053369.1.p1 GENE.GHVP01053369.1~~GHVP01053369.1.p1  ORF type:complete len:1517 (+),score=289.37 GHVP01053369.1:164-4714(+)